MYGCISHLIKPDIWPLSPPSAIQEEKRKKSKDLTFIYSLIGKRLGLPVKNVYKKKNKKKYIYIYIYTILYT